MTAQVEDTTAARNKQARDRARKAMAQVEVAPVTTVRYHSGGRVAVIGGMEAQEFAPRLQGDLRPMVVLVDGLEEPGVPVVPLGGRSLAITGQLGDFTLVLGQPGKPSHEGIRVDLILDLGDEPLLDMPMLPPGYLTVSKDDEVSLSAAILELEALVGTFEKPRFFDYDPALCAHQRAGRTACTRCIDACPAEAISSIAEAVEVDVERCQGGGVCATVCPAGAIRYGWPGVEDSLERVKRLIGGYLAAGGQAPVLVIVSDQDAPLETGLPSNQLLFEVEELASLGLEFWLGALSYGARRIELLSREPLPQRVESSLEQQLAVGRRVIAALGFPEDVLARRILNAEEESRSVLMPVIEAAVHAPVGGKRQLFYTALDHLHAQATHARPMVMLEAGAPFGSVQVDEKRCTLCSACVGACPGKALQSLTDEPGIRFVEANCLQCGMCTRTCPEDAIAITPRLLFEREKRNEQRLLHREEPFHCISCGEPFATLSVVNHMHAALKGHWMFQDQRARQRLKMCDQCRVVDITQDQEAMSTAGGVRMEH